MSRKFMMGIALLLAVCSTAGAEPWNAYQGNAARTGYTSDPLPEQLRFQWRYRCAKAAEPAWPRSPRMPFDWAPRVVESDGRIYFGHSVDGVVRCLDMATGRSLWQFPTEGPIRFAPIAWKDRLLVVSDDGFLYSLDATTGKLLWRRRGGPDDRMVLGNERLISKWPIRGGPVVVDDTLYLAAGIWPTDLIYLCALDAATGEPRWINDTACTLFMPQPHNTAMAESGISAQGYLAVDGDHLLVPTGRAVPAVFNRNTGELEYFHLQKYGQLGGSPILAAGGRYYNSGTAFDTATGEMLFRLGPGQIAQLPDHLAYATAGTVMLCQMKTAQEPDRRGNPVQTEFYEPIWKQTGLRTDAALVATPNRIVTTGAGGVDLLDREAGRPIQSFDVEGTPYGAAVCSGRLILSTDRGEILCFGDAATGADVPVAVFDESAGATVVDETPDIKVAVENLATQIDLQDGRCVILGHDRALDVARAIAARSRMEICLVEPDARRCAAFRDALLQSNQLGRPITVLLRDRLAGLPDYFADAVVSLDPIEGDRIGGFALQHARRLLRPGGGTLISDLAGSPVVERREPLESAGRWTHQYADAANTVCSGDQLVRGRLTMLWYRDVDFNLPSRHGRGPAPLYDDGRLIYAGIDGLIAVDAYNGRELWRYDIPSLLTAYNGDELMGTTGIGGIYCLGAGSVFVRHGDHCRRIDAKTGQETAVYPVPSSAKATDAPWGYVACVGNTLLGSAADDGHTVTYRYVDKGGDMSRQWTESKTLFAYDVETGRLKWQHEAEYSIRHNAIAVADGKVFLIDRPLALFDRQKQPDAKEHPPGKLLALDLESGNVIWQSAENIYGTTLACAAPEDVLLMSYQSTRFQLDSETGGRMAAFSMTDGRRLWDVEAAYRGRLILNGPLVYAENGVWDLKTGATSPFALNRSYGCGIVAMGLHTMVFRSATLGYRDLSSDVGLQNYGGIRPGCWINAIPVGGLVLVPDATTGCQCSYLNQSWFALRPEASPAVEVQPPEGAFAEPIRATIRAAGGSPGVIRYTLDGHTPTAESSEYREPIPIEQTALLRAALFDADGYGGRIISARYRIDPNLLPLEDARWTVWDVPGKDSSRWSVDGGTVRQTSNIYVGDAADSSHETRRDGTFRFYRDGYDFTDGAVSLEMVSTDDDGMGIGFRMKDAAHGYLYTTDAQRRFRVLARIDGDAYQMLDVKHEAYAPSRPERVRIECNGSKLAVFIDDRKTLEADDATFATGTIALYSWGSDNVAYRWISVER